MVRIATAVRNEIAELVAHHGGQWQIQAEQVGHGGDLVQILQLQPRRAAGCEAAVHHAAAMQVEDAAFGKAAADRLAEFLAAGAAGLDQDHRLGDGADGDRDDLLVGELADLAGARGADMGDAAQR